jgi:hypothetical protein
MHCTHFFIFIQVPYPVHRNLSVELLCAHTFLIDIQNTGVLIEVLSVLIVGSLAVMSLYMGINDVTITSSLCLIFPDVSFSLDPGSINSFCS